MMPTPETSPSPSFRTFEVQIPSTSPDQLLAFQGLARAFGLAFHETTPPPEAEGTPLTDELLTASSVELFGSEVYGQNAADTLKTLKDAASGTASAYRGELIWHWNDNHNLRRPAYWVNRRQTTSARTTLELERQVRSRLEGTNPPFSVLTTLSPHDADNDQGKSESLRVGFEPGVITVERLAGFVTARGYHEHKLHGAIGKTLSTMAHAAGVAPVPLELDVPTEFLEYSELDRIITDSLTPQGVRVLDGRIRSALEEQLDTGRPTKHGEVVVEGWLRTVGVEFGKHLTYDRIARRSLEVVAAGYPRQTITTDLLHRLAALSA